MDARHDGLSHATRPHGKEDSAKVFVSVAPLEHVERPSAEGELPGVANGGSDSGWILTNF